MRSLLCVLLLTAACVEVAPPLTVQPPPPPPPPFAGMNLGDAQALDVLGFSADGRYLVYLADVHDLRGELRAVDLGTGQVRSLDTDVVSEPDGMGERARPNLNPRGDGVLYRRARPGPGLVSLEQSDLYYVRFDGTPNRIGTGVSRDLFRFASHGRRVLYVEGDTSLHVWDLDTGAQRQVVRDLTIRRSVPTTDVTAAEAHAFLPLTDDERAIVYTVGALTYVQALDEQAPLAVIPGAPAGAVRVVDGHVLALTGTPGRFVLVDRELTSGTELRSPPAERIVVRDDGRWAVLLGAADASGAGQVAIYDVRRGIATDVDPVSAGSEVAFGPAETAVLLEPSTSSLFRLDLTAKTRTLIDDASVWSSFLTMTFDGPRLMYVRGEAGRRGGALMVADLVHGGTSLLHPDAFNGSVTITDGGRVMLFAGADERDSSPRPLIALHVDTGSFTELGYAGVLPLPGGRDALLARRDPTDFNVRVSLRRWADGSERLLDPSPAGPRATTEAFALLEVQSATDPYLLELKLVSLAE